MKLNIALRPIVRGLSVAVLFGIVYWLSKGFGQYLSENRPTFQFGPLGFETGNEPSVRAHEGVSAKEVAKDPEHPLDDDDDVAHDKYDGDFDPQNFGNKPDAAHKPSSAAETDPDPAFSTVTLNMIQNGGAFNGKHNEKQQAVIDAFRETMSEYRASAWGHDEVKPISRVPYDWFGIGLMMLDNLDLAIIMGQQDWYEKMHSWVASFDVHKGMRCNTFETTIRALGGVLSAYYLTGDEVFLDVARKIGYPLVDSTLHHGNKIPDQWVNLVTGGTPGVVTNLAEVGTLQLEWTYLSYAVQDPWPAQAAHQIYEEIWKIAEDGLVDAVLIATPTLRGSGPRYTMNGGSDSYYEYLLKLWIQTGKTEQRYLDEYVAAIRNFRTHFMRQSQTSKLWYIGEFGRDSSGNFFEAEPMMEHLACFLPGTLMLGWYHNVPDRDEHRIMAERLLETCMAIYETPTGLAPENVYFGYSAKGRHFDQYPDVVVSSKGRVNHLRPETVESLWYFYVITGEKKWQDYGWKYFNAFHEHARLPEGGYATVVNVFDVPASPYNKLHTFWSAETLKYFFLLFADHDEQPFPLNNYVFTTEAHPLPVLGGRFDGHTDKRDLDRIRRRIYHRIRRAHETIA
eukprot:Clim_evm75s172 gene=Clim_evmTU75s172